MGISMLSKIMVVIWRHPNTDPWGHGSTQSQTHMHSQRLLRPPSLPLVMHQQPSVAWYIRW